MRVGTCTEQPDDNYFPRVVVDLPPLWQNVQVQTGAGGGKLKVARVTVVRQMTVLDGLAPGSEQRGLRCAVCAAMNGTTAATACWNTIHVYLHFGG